MRHLALPTCSLLLLLSLGGCSQITDFGRFEERDAGGAQDGAMDGATDARVDGGDDASMDASTDAGGDGSTDAGMDAPLDATADATPDAHVDAGPCEPGFGDCDGDPSNGCETELGTSINCTACGDVCNFDRATGTCDESAGCRIASCDSGWGDCDDDLTNGCEQALDSAAHCGTCERSCGGDTPICDGDSCVSEDACELTVCGESCVDTSTNESHCGGCNQACNPDNATGECEGGECTLGSCDATFQDCNGDPDDGCEQKLEPLFADADGDGHGADGSGTVMCPESGYVTSAGDCDDTDDTIYDGAEELCDGKDNDCDGTADDDFECVLGASRECDASAGTCTATGTETCTDTCTWSECVPPPEVCNRADDDCNGFVDDGLLVESPPAEPLASVSDASNVRVAWSPSRSQFGVTWTRSGSGTSSFVFAAADADGTLFGSPVAIDAEGQEFDGDVAWDGSQWVVAYAKRDSSGATSRLEAYWTAVDPETLGFADPMAFGTVLSVQTGGPREVRLAWSPGTGTVAAVWHREGIAPSPMARIEGATIASGSITGPTTIASASDELRTPTIAGIPGGTFAVAWPRVQRGGSPGGADPARVEYTTVNASVMRSGAPVPLADDTGVVESGLDAAWEGDADRVVLTYAKDDGASRDWTWLVLQADGTVVGGERSLGGLTRARPAHAGDSAIGLLRSDSSGNVIIRRYLTDAGTAFPSDVGLTTNPLADVAGAESGSTHYGVGYATNADVRLTPVVCDDGT